MLVYGDYPELKKTKKLLKKKKKKELEKQDNLPIIRVLLDGRSQADNRLLGLMAADYLHVFFFFFCVTFNY